jgi:hypothetical protein
MPSVRLRVYLLRKGTGLFISTCPLTTDIMATRVVKYVRRDMLSSFELAEGLF